MTQVLSQPPALPRMGDRLFLAGASPYSKVTAAAKRKREYRDAGFRGGCQTCEASSKRAPDAQAAPEASSSGFGSLVDNLLYGAASQLERGQATCRACKGTGTLECSTCRGTGVVQPQKVRMNQLRHAVNRVKALVGLDKGLYDTQWLKTNRCLKCHGAGRAQCVACEGLGMRAPRAPRASRTTANPPRT